MSTVFYPSEWESLSKPEILASLPEYLDSNQLFYLAELSLARNEANDAFYYYLKSIGRGNSHIGVLSRAFELIFCDSNYLLAEWVAEQAKKQFSESAHASLMLARIAATRGDEVEFKSKLREAEHKGASSEQIASIKKHSGHFFISTIAN